MIRMKDEHVVSIYLLSVEEAKSLPRYLLTIGECWWLRSPGACSDDVTLVDIDGSIYTFGDTVYYSLGVRPALEIKNLDSLNFEIGETVKVLGLMAQYIGNNSVLLCESIAKHNFDTKSNDYEISEIKRFIEKWLEKRKNERKPKMTREDAIENIEFLLDNPCIHCLTKETENALGMAVEALQEPEQKKGKWIDTRDYCGEFMCSNCHETNINNFYNYCPHCGAKMTTTVQE